VPHIAALRDRALAAQRVLQPPTLRERDVERLLFGDRRELLAWDRVTDEDVPHDLRVALANEQRDARALPADVRDHDAPLPAPPGGPELGLDDHELLEVPRAPRALLDLREQLAERHFARGFFASSTASADFSPTKTAV